MSQLTPNQTMLWDALGNACLIIGTITVPASIAASYPTYVPIIGVVIAAAGGLGKAIIQKMSTPQGQAQIASTQQVIVDSVMKVAAMPADQQQAALQSLVTFIHLFASTQPPPAAPTI